MKYELQVEPAVGAALLALNLLSAKGNASEDGPNGCTAKFVNGVENQHDIWQLRCIGILWYSHLCRGVCLGHRFGLGSGVLSLVVFVYSVYELVCSYNFPLCLGLVRVDLSHFLIGLMLTQLNTANIPQISITLIAHV